MDDDCCRLEDILYVQGMKMSGVDDIFIYEKRNNYDETLYFSFFCVARGGGHH